MMVTSYEEQTNMAFTDAYQQPSSWCLDSGCTMYISHVQKSKFIH